MLEWDEHLCTWALVGERGGPQEQEGIGIILAWRPLPVPMQPGRQRGVHLSE